MTKLKTLSCFLAAVMLLTCITPSTLAASSSAKDKKTTLVVSAGAGIRDAMDEIIKNFEKANPNVNVLANYAASGTLKSQILYGGKADVFMSPSTEDMDQLEKSGFVIPGTRIKLAGNDLVLIMPTKPQNGNLKIENFKDLLDPRIKLIAIGDPNIVPAGKFALQAAEFYKVDYTVRSKATYGKDIRQVLRYVESGNVDAGIVYLTDAITTDKVKIACTAAENSHKPIIFTAAAMKRGENNATGKAFVKFLNDDSSTAVFKKYGFKTL